MTGNEMALMANIAVDLQDKKVGEVLDKIRAEIEQTANDYEKSYDYRYVRGLWIALGIIDKHKAEKE